MPRTAVATAEPPDEGRRALYALIARLLHAAGRLEGRRAA